MGSFLRGDISAYDRSDPRLQGYNRPSDTTPKIQESSNLLDILYNPNFFKDQAKKASETTKEMGYVSGLQYDPWDADLSGKALEPKLNQRMTYDPMDLGSVDYLGRATAAGPNLGYEPEDMYQGEKESMSMSDWLKKNKKDLATAAIAATNAATSRPTGAEGSSISPRGSAANYAAPGRLGAGPFAPVNPRPDYQTLAQNAFRSALVEYILKNPKQNIKGML